MRTLIKETIKKTGDEVKIQGWVQTRRDLGKIIFLDVRDRSGLIQVVCAPKELGEEYKLAEKAKAEYVVELQGMVGKRQEKNFNSNLVTGQIEIQAKGFKILNESRTPPFEIENEDQQVNEELRLKYRYLDLRRERMKSNLIFRNLIISFLRRYLEEEGFIEVETPILTKGTPEGAREFLVPSRLHRGKFYVLPQSPQQFKQLLMVAGLEKYFQIARCFRDEDQRGDRQPEFTQLDLELSFIEQEDIMRLMEIMVKKLVENLEIVRPGLKISADPFPRLTYHEAMTKYKSDKPDLRKKADDPKELAFCWIIDPPLFEYSETEKKIVSVHHPFTHPHPEDLDFLEKKPEQARALAYDLVLNGYEVGGGSIRIHQKNLQKKIFDILGLSNKEAQGKFGHLLEAFGYGAPPHGGLAIGLDRLIMLLAGEPNIREVMAFPKTSDARDPLFGAPAEALPEQLKDVHLRLDL